MGQMLRNIKQIIKFKTKILKNLSHENIIRLRGVKAGDMIEVGVSQLKVAGVIAEEPDAPLSVFGNAPRLLMHVDDVAATEVVQPGSRIGYRYQFAGPDALLSQLETEVKPLLRSLHLDPH